MDALRYEKVAGYDYEIFEDGAVIGFGVGGLFEAGHR